MAENIQKGIIGILALLMGFGGGLLLDSQNLDNYYICSVNENLAYFDRLSSTSKTGYWTDDSGGHSSVCRNGYWVKLIDYANEKGVNPNTFLFKENLIEESQNKGAKYSCNNLKCEVIDGQ